MSEKKNLLLFVLKILRANSSKEAPLSSSDICNILSDSYGKICDKRTLKSTIVTLSESGYQVRQIKRESSGKNKTFWYLDHALSDDEVDLLSLALISSPYLTSDEADKLRHKLTNILGFDIESTVSRKSISQNHTASEINKLIKLINSAIIEKRMLSFSIIACVFGQKILLKRNEITTKTYLVRPIEIISANSRLLLFCELGDTGIYRFFALDDIYGPKLESMAMKNDSPTAPLPSSPLEASAMTLSDHLRATVRVHNDYLADFVHQLGISCEVICRYDNKTEIAVTTDPRALKRLILAFGGYAEALTPTKLRRAVALELREAISKYPDGRRLHGTV